MEPVLKWAGGKRQLLKELHKIITPESLIGHTLYEPFVGGGSVFLSYEHDKVKINDSNAELVNVYKVIKRSPKKLVAELRKHKEAHCREHYYQVRSWDRTEDYAQLSDVERAARIVYLNRTCFNGLYRVNTKGCFNVPLGRYVNPEIVNEEKIMTMHKYLFEHNVAITCGDFQKAIRNVKAGDTIYFDPPYDYEETGFTSYTADAFSKADLMRLKCVCDELIANGCRVVVSNNNTAYVNDIFSGEKYTKRIVLAKRMINCNGQRRNEVNEVIIYG